jgi:hypothetical protein
MIPTNTKAISVDYPREHFAGLIALNDKRVFRLVQERLERNR